MAPKPQTQTRSSSSSTTDAERLAAEALVLLTAVEAVMGEDEGEAVEDGEGSEADAEHEEISLEEWEELGRKLGGK
ncbi:hypothetical protein LTR95_004254 [Oleoguttula sp. CCFEE 5521]